MIYQLSRVTTSFLCSWSCEIFLTRSNEKYCQLQCWNCLCSILKLLWKATLTCALGVAVLYLISQCSEFLSYSLVTADLCLMPSAWQITPQVFNLMCTVLSASVCLEKETWPRYLPKAKGMENGPAYVKQWCILSYLIVWVFYTLSLPFQPS